MENELKTCDKVFDYQCVMLFGRCQKCCFHPELLREWSSKKGGQTKTTDDQQIKYFCKVRKVKNEFFRAEPVFFWRWAKMTNEEKFLGDLNKAIHLTRRRFFSQNFAAKAFFKILKIHHGTNSRSGRQ